MEEKTLCPSCNREIPPLTVSCQYCGQRLRSVKLSCAIAKSDRYVIVPDGQQFAITLRGEVKVYGLNKEDLSKAEEIIAVLNSIDDPEEMPAISGSLEDLWRKYGSC